MHESIIIYRVGKHFIETVCKPIFRSTYIMVYLRDNKYKHRQTDSFIVWLLNIFSLWLPELVTGIWHFVITSFSYINSIHYCY